MVAGIFALLAYSGLFHQITFQKGNFGPYTLVYQKHIGDYSQVGQAMTEVYENLKKAGVTTTRGLGIYYDDPQKVKPENLRSIVGSILEEQDENRVAELSKSFNVATVPAQGKALSPTFPIRTSFQLSSG